MDVALVFNTETGFSREMSATEFERLYRGNAHLGITPAHPEEAEKLEVVSLKDAVPLTFRRSYTRMGDEEIVRACWVRPPGFGDHDHVFNRQAQQGLGEAVKQGKSVLLSLNLNLSSRPVSFENLPEKGAKNLKDWITANRGQYITIPVHSAQEARAAILKVHELDQDFPLSRNLFALHKGAVVPYRNFFLGHREEDISHLYNALQGRRAGVPVGETRMIGFPRLFRLVPASTTISEQATKGIKGNTIRQEQGKPLFSSLIFTNHDEVLKSDPYRILTSELLAHHDEGVYVLASPSVTVGEPQDDWKMIRWIVNDIEAQTTPAHRDKADDREEQSPEP
ncbi:MAG: hypothetical protein KDI90_11390 [Alphaproteobacteria bacterium]|nr:hypothetical protein [Alphaproteobacteria bacterium]